VSAARVIDGRAIAAQILADTCEAVRTAVSATGRGPGLAVVLVGSNPASQIYVAAKLKRAREVGIETFEHRVDEIGEVNLLRLIERLNHDPEVHGILVQLPLPAHVDSRKVIAAISPDKDVDGFHPQNLGRLFSGMPSIVACTPRGCLELIRSELPDLKGADAVVVGASNIVGRPMAALLLNEGCTVSVAHKLSRDLPDLTRRADVLVVAAGQPGLIRGDMLKRGVIVIDVGITRVSDPVLGSRIVGDVDFEDVSRVAGAVTPVPGGVGPMTVAFLMVNTMNLFRRSLDGGDRFFDVVHRRACAA